MKITKNRLSEWLVAAAIMLALVLLVNPFGIIMTSAYILTVLMLLGLAVLAFGAFVWRERYRDEREERNAMKAGRLSYFAGGVVLVIAIAVETFAHALDVWLIATLAAMVVTKLAVGIWLHYR